MKPERSVEEILEEFQQKVQRSSKDNGFRNQNDGYPNRFLMNAWLEKTLQAERQKREEIVQQLEEQKTGADFPDYDGGWDSGLEKAIEIIRETNNPK